MPNQSLVPIVGKCLLGIVFIAGLSHDNHQIPVKDQASAMRLLTNYATVMHADPVGWERRK